MTLNDEFFQNLSDDDYEAASQLAAEFDRFNTSFPPDSDVHHIGGYAEFASAALALADIRENNFGLDVDVLDFSLYKDEKTSSELVSIVQIFFNQLDIVSKGTLINNSVRQNRAKFGSLIATKFRYEFTDGDLNKIQSLLDELRQYVSVSTELEQSHKQRILKRLERLQQELHKKMGDLDRFWGLVGDAGVVVGKLGKDAKPIVDRIKEIADIVWRTQATAEELPTNSPLPKLESLD